MKTSLKTIQLLCLIGLAMLTAKASADQVRWDFTLAPYMTGSEGSFTGSILADSKDFTLSQHQESDPCYNFTYDIPNAVGSYTFLGVDGITCTHDFVGVAATIDHSPGDTFFSLMSTDSSFYIATLSFHKVVTDSSLDTLLSTAGSGYSHVEATLVANNISNQIFDNIDLTQTVSSVPEPSTLMLVVVGGLGAFALRRKK